MSKSLRDCHNFHDLRELARVRLPSPIFHYIDGAADDEVTYRRGEVIAVDTDAALTDELRQRAATAGFQNLTAYQGDALRMAYPRFDLCVANLPFQISSTHVCVLWCACNGVHVNM